VPTGSSEAASFRPLLTEERRMPERPWCCPEPRCAPLHLLAEAVAPGESFVCFGKAPEVEFTYDGVAHTNDLRSCHYTPLKGLIAYQENRDDWEAMRAGYWRALAALDTRVFPPAADQEATDA
jgi:hypothetical protein